MIWIDYAILLITLPILLIFGLTGRKRNDTIEGFFLGSRNLNWLRVGASLFATNFSAAALVGITGAAYLTGIAIYNYEWVGILALIFLALVLYKILLGSGIFTVSEYLQRRFDDRVMLFYSVFVIVMIIFIDLASALYVGGLILSSLIPTLSLNNVIYFAVVFSGLYVLTGGLTAISRTDSLQFTIIIAGSVTLAYFSFGAIQNIDNYASLLSENSLSLIRPIGDRAVPWPGLLTGVPILCAYFWFANQNMLQWGLSAKSVQDAQIGLIFVGFLKLAVFFIVVLPGVFAAVLFPGIADPDKVYLVLLTELLPAGALGLVITGLGAALLSNTDSSLHAASTIFTLDIVRRFKSDLTDRQLIVVSRGFTVFIIFTGAVWAQEIAKFDTLFEYIQSTLSYSITPIITVYTTGLFSRRINANAAFYSLLIGAGASTALFVSQTVFGLFEVHYLYVPLPICVLCLISMYLISYFDSGGDKDKAPDLRLVWMKEKHSMSQDLGNSRILYLSVLLLMATLSLVGIFAFPGNL